MTIDCSEGGGGGRLWPSFLDQARAEANPWSLSLKPFKDELFFTLEQSDGSMQTD